MQKFMGFLVMAGLVLVLAVPAAAAEKTIEERLTSLEKGLGNWTIYGSARYATFYNDSDLSSSTDEKSLRWDSQANARLGGKVIKDQITGVYELGLDDDSPAGVYTRLIYGAYDFGVGSILIGQDYSPISSIFYSNQVVNDDLDLFGWGAVYEGRLPQIKLKFKGLEVAFVENKASSKLNATTGSAEVLSPKFEARYHLEKEKFFADMFGGFSTFKVKDIVVGGVNYGDDTVNAWTVGVGGGLKLDPAYIKAQVYLAQNAKNFGLWHTDSAGAQFDENGDVVNEDNFGTHIVVGTKISKYTVEAGFGYVSSQLDDAVGTVGDDKNTAMTYYLNAIVPIYGPFFVVPEIGVLDYADNSNGDDEDKDTTYVGAKWQINF